MPTTASTAAAIIIVVLANPPSSQRRGNVSSPLERAFRDAHVVTQHLSLTARLQEDAGRVLLGLEPREPFF